ncbi:hypothetical protein PG989_003788 [Apiospora arundinis]
MARPIRIPRTFASRALMAAPVHVSRPASLLASTSCHPVACLAAQKRHISQHTPLRAPLDSTKEPISPTPTEADAHSASHSATNEAKPLQEAIGWGIRMEKDQMLTGHTVSLMSHGKTDRVLDRHWLRDGCACSACVDPHSGQKNFGTTDVPLDLPISSCQRTKSGDLEIVWQNDFLTSGRESHTSTYPAEQVQSILGSSNTVPALPRKILWDKERINKDLMFVEYDDWMKNDEAVNAGVRMLHTHGILFIRNAPHSEESVISMSSRIGNLKETLYGRTWDVRSKPEAENVAYTSSFLGLHQDMLYLKDPPRLQLLHCLQNSCEGGESLFSDANLAAYLIKIGSAEITESLRKQEIKYHYKKHGHFYENYHPVVNENQHVRWSPPFQAPFTSREYTKESSKGRRKWVSAVRKFQELLEKEEFLFEYKMNPGDCVIFDNLRVVHGRRAFDTSVGSRWLKGTYNAQDVFKSKLKLACADLAVAAESSEEPTMLEQAGALNEKHRIWDNVDLTGKKQKKFKRSVKSSATESKKSKPSSNHKTVSLQLEGERPAFV